MVANVFLLLSLVPIILAETTPERHMILHCLSLLYCNGKTPVCGANGTHCWHADSDCERSKFNCLQLHQKDYDKVPLSYCSHFTVGAIGPCCMRKQCPNKHEPVCGEVIDKTLNKCKWFKNRCEMESVNCEGGEGYEEVNQHLCNFTANYEEGFCTKPID